MNKYEEIWSPSWWPISILLPCFRKYSVTITHDNSLIFGYGFGFGNKPQTEGRSIISHKVENIVKNIEYESIQMGSADWKENFKRFGGWGIRLGRTTDGKHFLWAYNAANGPFVEFTELVLDKDKNKNDCIRRRYWRFATKDANRVVSILRDTCQPLKEKSK